MLRSAYVALFRQLLYPNIHHDDSAGATPTLSQTTTVVIEREYLAQATPFHGTTLYAWSGRCARSQKTSSFTRDSE